MHAVVLVKQPFVDVRGWWPKMRKHLRALDPSGCGVRRAANSSMPTSLLCGGARDAGMFLREVLTVSAAIVA
ncbi:hypothetical protein ABIF67_006274 [Bradyrhizobium japonicum]